MNIKQIRQLVGILKESGLGVIEITEGESKIRLEAAQQASPAVVMAAAAPSPSASSPAVPAAPTAPAGVDFNDMTEIKSPMVGVFYTAPSPESDPFVTVGKRIKKGDVLCIIEAMKLMNEIVAEEDGEIVDICVANGDIVEYGQTLFKLF